MNRDELEKNVAKLISKCKSSVTCWDYTDFDPDLCNNGGKYWFNTRYYPHNNGWWSVAYDTSSDLPWDPAEGRFTLSSEGTQSGTYEEVPTAVVIKDVCSYLNNDNENLFVTIDDGEGIISL